MKPGKYSVELHFAEIILEDDDDGGGGGGGEGPSPVGPGRRLFDVYLQVWKEKSCYFWQNSDRGDP